MNIEKILLLILLNTYLFGLGTCQMENEYKNATILNETRNVIDYTDKITRYTDSEPIIADGSGDESKSSIRVYDRTTYFEFHFRYYNSIGFNVNWDKSTGNFYNSSPTSGAVTVSTSSNCFTSNLYDNGSTTFCLNKDTLTWSGSTEVDWYGHAGNIRGRHILGLFVVKPSLGDYPAYSMLGMEEGTSGVNVPQSTITLLHGCPSGGTLNSSTNQCEEPVCPTGYTDNGANCKKTISYTYQNMTCDINDKNVQGYGWTLTSNPISDGSKTDTNIHITNSTTLDDTLQSHESSISLCARQYQECSISCDAPLTLDTETGKCVMSYAASCAEKGMVYNETLNICEKENQCNNANALKDDDSNYCRLDVACNVIDGVCGETPIKSCENNEFNYLNSSNRCEADIGCNENQIMIDNEMCGSIQYCEDDDTQTATACIRTTQVQKSCSPDGRDGNLCYKSQEGNIDIEYKKELQRADINGSFKALEYGNLKNTYCTNDDNNKCTFRLTKIYAQNDGKELCFKDHLNSVGCITIEGECTVDGEIEFEDGIRQLYVENDNHYMVAYNKAIQTESVGSIHSNCSLSGKVGSINSPDNNKEIISAQANGIDIKFWDSYKRGDIGVITFLPTIPEEDIDDGYNYEDPEIMKLYKENYTGFYSNNGKTYAVYNGLISRDKCRSDINGTSFYIPQAENEEEEGILNMLSLLSEGEYNFNSGNDTNGTCVIVSSTAKSFNNQIYSIKTVSLDNTNTQYVCSPLKCTDHYCQENQCPNGFNGSEVETSELEQFMRSYFPDLTLEDICKDEVCDSNKPYFPYCGNTSACSSSPDVFQQEDGKCVTISCDNDDSFDYSTNQCKKLECVDSVEVDGKCIKTLN